MTPCRSSIRGPGDAVLGTFALVGVTLLAFGHADPAAGQTPSPGSLDPTVLDSIFAPWDRDGSPGCAVGVYRSGETVLARGYGEANLDWEIPITPRTVFYSGSVSKQFAASTAALLHLEGSLDLDADVRGYIPELPVYDPPVTVRHLIHHTSGVRDIYGLIALSGGRVADAWTDHEYLELLARQTDLNFPPGSEYLYSNGAYYLLTTVVERSSGERLDDVARRLIFDPLGMDDTHFHQDRERIVPRRAMSYGGNADDGFRQTYLGNFDKAGAGGLYTTIGDLAAWNRSFENGTLAGDAFLELIQTPAVLSSGDTLSYAFGLQWGELEDRPTVGHGGSFMGFRADFVRFPEDDLALAALCNLGEINPGELTRRGARAILGLPPTPEEEEAVPEAEPSEPPTSRTPGSAPLKAYAGIYRSPEVDATVRVQWTGTELEVVRPGPLETTELRWQGGDRFQANNWTLEFQVHEGKVVSFRLDAGRVKNLLYGRER